MKRPALISITITLLILTIPVAASPVLEKYAQQAHQNNPGFDGFSAKRGQAFFLKQHAAGKADTPACTSCHSDTPTKAGLTRAGKDIAPLATSVSPDRYINERKVEKWFRRNCKSVLGRICTALEKGDFITFMQTQ